MTAINLLVLARGSGVSPIVISRNWSKKFQHLFVNLLLVLVLTCFSARAEVEWTGGSHGQVVTCHSSTGDYQVTYPNDGRWDQNTDVNGDGCTVALSNWSTPTYPTGTDVDVLIGAQSGAMSYPPYLPQWLTVAVHNVTVDGSGQLVLGGPVDLHGQLSIGDNAVATLWGGAIFGRSEVAAIMTEGSGVLAVGDGQTATLSGDLSIDATLMLGQGTLLNFVDLPELIGILRISSTGSANTISTIGSNELLIPPASSLTFEDARTSFGRRRGDLNLRLNNTGEVNIGNGSNITFGMADQGGTALINDGTFSMVGNSVATLIVSNLAGEANNFTFDNRNGQLLVNESSSLFLSRNARILGGTVVTGVGSAIRVSDQVGDSASGSLSGNLNIDATFALEGYSALSIWGDTTLTGNARIVTSGSGNRVFASTDAGPWGVQVGTLIVSPGSQLHFDGANTALGRNLGVINEGTVEFNAANVSVQLDDQVRTSWVNDGQVLVRDGSTVGLVRATDYSFVFTFDNRNGQLLIADDSSLYLSRNARILGGTVSTTDTSTIRVGNHDAGSLSGNLNIDATFALEGYSALSIWGDTTLTGNARIVTSGSGNRVFASTDAGPWGVQVGTLIVSPGSQLHFDGANTALGRNLGVINEGTVEFNAANVSVEISDLVGSGWQNDGQFLVRGGSTVGLAGYSGTFDNRNGGIEVSDGSTIYLLGSRILGDILLKDHSLLRLIDGGSLQEGVVDMNDGRLQVEPGGSHLGGQFIGSDWTLSMLPGTNLTVDGELGLSGVVSFESTAAMSSYNSIGGNAVSQLIVESDSSLSFMGSGWLRIFGPSIANLGTIEVHPGIGVTWESNSLQNQGLIRIASGGYSGIVGAMTLDNTGGTVIIDEGGSAYFEGTKELGGRLVVDGTLTIPELTVLGELEGNGAIQGNVVGKGLVAPGNSPGRLIINGNLTQPSSSLLEIELGGTTPGTQHDQLVVTGSASLGGTLFAPIVSNYVPQLGDSVTILTSANVTGQFTSVLVLGLQAANPNLAIDIDQSATEIQLHFVAPLSNIQFVPNNGVIDWANPDAWSTGIEPDTRNIVSIQNPEGVDQRLNIEGTDVLIHQIDMVGDSSNTMTLNIRDGRSLSATIGASIGDNAILALGSESSSGNLVTPTMTIQNGGTFSGNGLLRLNIGGALKKIGSAIRNRYPGNILKNKGKFRPGFSVGRLDVDGDFEQETEGILEIELESASSFDKVVIMGAATLGGTLDVSLLSFAPQSGDSFDILDWETVTGTFDTVNLPTLAGGLTWNLSQLYNTGSLAVAGILGDYNLNGIVDAADYTVWRDTLGSVAILAADGNGNGVIDAGDQVVWREHFGQLSSSTGIGSIIPEPSMLLLTTFALGGALLMLRRRVCQHVHYSQWCDRSPLSESSGLSQVLASPKSPPLPLHHYMNPPAILHSLCGLL